MLSTKQPSRLSRTSTKRKKKRDDKKKSKDKLVDESKQQEASDWQVQTKIIPCEDKLDLTPEELNKVHDRLLEATDPNAPENIARWSFSDQCYKNEPTVEQTAFHYKYDGVIIRKDSDEAKAMKEEMERRQLLLKQKIEQESKEGITGEITTQQLHNQFTFSERATQTFRDPLKHKEIKTDPPPSWDLEGSATQWEIYDLYMAHLAQQEKQQSGKKGSLTNEESEKAVVLTPNQIMQSDAMKKAVKLMERMINQNIYDEILYDFKFWDDDSDKFREFGRLLPLWRFTFSDVKKKHVTSLCWNPQYHDLFAVGYGSYDFMKQGTGAVCCFTLKNPSYPEYFFTTESGVMCLDFHPKHTSLLAVGLYDGTVLIYDVRQKDGKPLIKSTVKTGKHSDVVWQVSWQPESISQSLTFFSVSSDGRVTSWTLSKNELQHTDIMHLKIDGAVVSTEEHIMPPTNEHTPTEETLVGLAGGTCFDFNKKIDHLFVVGTEEGKIHLCSKAYNSQYLQTYEGHHMSVYAVKWNYYHQNVFLSASADWSVKLWDMNYKHAMMTFDLGSAVGDVAWAPYSSTVFAAVTDDGKVHVYDLNSNKHDSLCDQLVVKRAKLTHIAFNPTEPIILVGDDHGLVQTHKLSPNLRQSCKLQQEEKMEKLSDLERKKKEAEKVTPEQLEIQKLDKILQTQIKSFNQGF